ncbi:hypothetical protein V2J09_004648 [Rumex salicifolius]
MSSQEKEATHNINHKGNTSPMSTFISTPKEPSRTFHSFPLGGSSPSALPRSKSFGFKPNRVRNLHWSSTATQTGLGVVGDLSRTSTNKNLLVRPLVTPLYPAVVSHHDPRPPMSPNAAHSRGLCSKIGKILLQSFGTRVPKVVETSQELSGDQAIGNRDNRIRVSSDQVPVDEHTTNNPRKKAKRSEDVDVEESFMNYCFGCHKRLKETEDIYIFRGEMAFCSTECREKEMINQEKTQREASSPSRKPTIRDLHKG